MPPLPPALSPRACCRCSSSSSSQRARRTRALWRRGSCTRASPPPATSTSTPAAPSSSPTTAPSGRPCTTRASSWPASTSPCCTRRPARRSGPPTATRPRGPPAASSSARGLSVTDADGATVLWSTTPRAPVAALRLRDDGNLQLLDARNATLWQSFDDATDALLPGQQLRAGAYLTSGRSPGDFARGDYRLAVSGSDVALTWQGSTYWQLSNDLRSFKDRNAAAAAMSFNSSGLFVVAADSALVFRVDFAPADFRVLKLGHDGRLRVTSYTLVNSSDPLGGDFVAPATDCELPSPCPSLGLCGAAGNSSTCTCPPLFAASVKVSGGCTPGDGSALASPEDLCRTNSSASSVSYLALKPKIAYSASRYDAPTTTGVNRTACRALCTANCTCLGYFHDNSSITCYLIGGRQLGSLHWSTRAAPALGYIKTISSATRAGKNKRDSSSASRSLPIVLPSVAAFLLIVVVAWYSLWWRRKRKSGKKGKAKNSSAKNVNLGLQNPRSRDASYDEDPDDDDIVIPGMPTRFSYEEIGPMTAGFGTKVGSGGFGSVYKGELPAGEGLVAVKRLEAVGMQAKREFCTEIAVIGNIRHVNLVRLRGFCAEGSRRLLVYEYMNRGSLDRSLFGATGAPVLEWGERMEVALGAARGLAYLHTGCDQKIVHCDVKPENILLADGGQVKVSDFGLAKLMSPEHSAIFTTMRGTRGYLAPEWLSNAPISDRADVYSFGMVLLELVHGRKNRGEQEQANNAGAAVGGSGDHSAFPSPSGHSSTMTSSTMSGGTSGGDDDYFPMVALELYEQGRYLDLVDRRLEGRVSEAEVARAVRLALCCLHEEPAQRPSMAAVVRVLEGSVPPPEPRGDALGFLRLYGRGYAMPAPVAGMVATSESAGHAPCHGWSTSATAGSQLDGSLKDTSVPR
ncbi:G-type lectin S-receptor-like serine/threonine-protein kinase At5g35370 [Triticum dicoccoides]|uniref:G-type lectin S-receptor-like serine/threonine-protein kinase At5g35370 n=1 Tax=Triticum dicoccoides TaxID=85692 RepID=UPI00188F08CB|nr:G-type lectin S-receptor-like serine/threonine-protein kinase At5g35370 [Triticum dicoccoides]